MGARIAAAFLDIILLVCLYIILGTATNNVVTENTGSSVTYSVGLSWPLFLVYQGVVFVYFTVQEAVWGTSVGKAALHLQVAAGGGRMTWRAAILRNIFRLIDWLPALYLVGVVVMLVQGDQRRIGDFVGGTRVGRAVR